MSPALVITHLTFLEAVRRRIALAAFVLGVAFLALFALGFYFIQRTLPPAASEPLANIMRSEIYSFFTNAGLYAVNFLSLAMSVLVSADTLAGEISSGSIQAIVTKPVRRAEIVVGKWLGFAGLIALYLTLMAGGVLGIVYIQVGYHVPDVLAGVGIMYLESVLIMTVTLLCSSMLSTLATGGVMFGLYGLAFIGGWVEQFGALAQMRGLAGFISAQVAGGMQTAVNIGIVSSLIMPSEALFRLAAFKMTMPVVQSVGLSLGPSLVISVPSPWMVVYALLYTFAALALTIRQFSRRDL